jgi:hypothetical protein
VSARGDGNVDLSTEIDLAIRSIKTQTGQPGVSLHCGGQLWRMMWAG